MSGTHREAAGTNASGFVRRGVTRRGFVAAGVASSLLALPIGRAWAAKAVTLKFATNLPLTHPLNVRVAEAAARIKRETNGEVGVRIFPDNQFGGDSEMLELLRLGGIDIFTPSALVLSALVPEVQINALGFAFSDYGKVWQAMDGDLGDFIRSAVGKAGLHMMETVCDNGFRQCTTASRPIQGPGDFSGLSIRVPLSHISISLFQALSARPRGLQFVDLYPALREGAFEAQENPLSIILSSRFYEVQKYVSLTNHMWDGFFFVFNGKTWSGLPGDIQRIVSSAFNDAAALQRADVATANTRALGDLKRKGMIFNETDPDPFRHALRKAGFYAEWKGRFGGKIWGILEKYTGRLG